MVAVVAGINKIRVLAAQVGCDALGDLMIELKVIQLGTPLFAFQAIDAAEVELVAQPRAMVGVFGIALRPVLAEKRSNRIVERQSVFHCLASRLPCDSSLP